MTRKSLLFTLLCAILCALFALGSIEYKVDVVERSTSPVLAYLDKTSTYQQIFNPTWVEPSSGTHGKRGLIARTQNCVSNVGDTCIFCGGSADKASILTFSEEQPDHTFKTVDESSVVFGPFDSSDSWGTEDPRMQYNPSNGLYYMFYTAYNGSAPMLNLATTKNPTAADSAWTRHGPVFPSYPNSKSAALLLREDGPHYLFWGDHDIRVATSSDPTVWSDIGTILLSPRTDNFDSQLVEAGPPPLRLSTGDYLFLYNSAELGWPTNTSTAYHVGYTILSGQDPTKVLARSSAPLLSPKYSWEQGVSPYACNVPNVVFLEAAHPIGDDHFKVYFGGADATIGSAIIRVSHGRDPPITFPEPKKSIISNDNSATVACVGCEDTCVLVPASLKYPCYQGSPSDVAACFATDPLLSEGTTWHCGHCVEYGFPKYIRNDPIYKDVGLWIV